MAEGMCALRSPAALLGGSVKKEAEILVSERVRDLTGLALVDLPKRLAEASRTNRPADGDAGTDVAVSAFSSSI